MRPAQSKKRLNTEILPAILKVLKKPSRNIAGQRGLQPGDQSPLYKLDAHKGCSV